MEYRTCTRCKITKELKLFVKDKKRKSGYRTMCKKCHNNDVKKYYEKCPEKRVEDRIRRKEKLKNYNRQWRSGNKEKQKEYSKKYSYNRYNNDEQFRLSHVLRKRVMNAMKRNSNNSSVTEIIGCSIQELRNHIENQFKPGMTWDNHGSHGWHIDHITPCSKYNLTDIEQQKQCFRYTNLQPLWSMDNRKKYNL